LYITEEAVLKLIEAPDVSITGDIYIVTEAGGDSLKDISFLTKSQLVEVFGNIDSSSNAVRIHYQTSEIMISNVTVASEVSVYLQNGESYPITRANMFNLTVSSGNDIQIVDDNGTARLNITYALSTNKTYATIDKYTGQITLIKSGATSGTATITIVAGSTITCKSTVKFEWQAPEIGDFAYADGSFSSGYDSGKTLVGLVYAKNEDTDTSGTVYIIGKEYTCDTELYAGYSADGVQDSDNETLNKLNSVNTWLTSTSSSIKGPQVSNYEVVNNITSQATLVSIENINVNTYNANTTGCTDNGLFSGDVDTALYIEHVNDNILQTLYAKNTATKGYISANSTEGTYSISSMNNLKSLCGVGGAMDSIYSSTNGSGLLCCVLFPYFYSFALYEPEATYLDSQYTKGNWYAPSIAELARVIYYRGYSVNGDSFDNAGDVREAINTNTNITVGTAILKKPIFWSAKKAMGANSFPSVWTNLCGSGTSNSTSNLATSINSSTNSNYLYQRVASGYTSDYSGYTYTNKW